MREFYKNPTDIYDEDKKSSKDLRKKDINSIHGFTLNDANEKIKEIIMYCAQNNFREILLITGKRKSFQKWKWCLCFKDLGKLKYSVPDYLETEMELKKYVLSVTEADVKDGGEEL